jgi:hypothetical protein
MKKMSIAVAALCLSVSMFSIATAGFQNGMGGGCADCAKQAATLSDPQQKFQADTIDLRQEMMNKRFEAQRENLKATPDNAKIAALQADIKLIQSKIMEIRSQSGLPTGKSDGECGTMMGGCDKKGMGGCDKKGMGGCNKVPCGSQN